MVLIKKTTIAVFILIFSIDSESQLKNYTDRLYIESNYHYGFVLPQIDYIGYFVNKHVQGIQVNVGLNTYGEKPWHQYFNYPQLGIGYYRSGLGNDKIFGVLNAGYFYADRLYLNNNGRFNFGNRICFGLCHINKQFDLYSNNYNIVISTRINAFIQYNIEGTAMVTPLAQLKIGFGVTHASNGDMYEPNKGFNLITAFAGLNYSFSDRKRKIIHEQKSDCDTVKNQFLLTGAYGLKQISRYNPASFSVYVLSAEYARRITHTNWLGLALTGYLDQSLRKEIEKSNPDTTTKPIDNLRIALNLSYEIKLGNVSYVFQPGRYLKNSYTHFGPITNRFAFRYHFDSGLTFGITIKAHWVAIADFIEWGVGYQW